MRFQCLRFQCLRCTVFSVGERKTNARELDTSWSGEADREKKMRRHENSHILLRVTCNVMRRTCVEWKRGGGEKRPSNGRGNTREEVDWCIHIALKRRNRQWITMSLYVCLPLYLAVVSRQLAQHITGCCCCCCCWCGSSYTHSEKEREGETSGAVYCCYFQLTTRHNSTCKQDQRRGRGEKKQMNQTVSDTVWVKYFSTEWTVARGWLHMAIYFVSSEVYNCFILWTFRPQLTGQLIMPEVADEPCATALTRFLCLSVCGLPLLCLNYHPVRMNKRVVLA